MPKTPRPYKDIRHYKAIRPMFKRDIWKIFPGDTVYIRTGPDRGETGKVLAVNCDKRCPEVIVENKNLKKKKIGMKPVQEGDLYDDADEHYVMTIEAPIHYSAVSLVDPKTHRCVSVSFRYTETGERVRVTTGKGASGAILPIPSNKPVVQDLAGTKDTPKKDALEATYNPMAPFPWKVPRYSPPGPIFYSTMTSSIRALHSSPLFTFASSPLLSSRRSSCLTSILSAYPRK